MTTSATTDRGRLLADVAPEYVFWCCDGRILRNMGDLRDAFATMTEETFAYHVNAVKNDFHNWVRDVLNDSVLADDLLKAADIKTACKIVSARIAFLSGKPRSTPVKKAEKEVRRKRTRR